MRELSYAQAVLEATDTCLADDPAVYVIGLGVPDPGGVFGTTKGLRHKYGSARVLDMPVAENGMTGIAVGSAIAGMRPIVAHHRVDFMLLALEQIVNQAAKWHYMFNGMMRVPLVIRAVIGRGWGQGPQHSQSLHSWFAHIPGLKVVMPFTPYDAKGLLISAVEDDNPVIFLEHRWLHGLRGEVPEGPYRVPLGKARVAREGADVSLLAVSHMTYEALRAAELLAEAGVSAEVVDIRCPRPLDAETVLASVRKTGRAVAVDPDWSCCGLAAELLALVSERAFAALKTAPARVTWPDHPVPTSPALSKEYYPGPAQIAAAALRQMGRPVPEAVSHYRSDLPADVPDLAFAGPF